MRAELRRKRAAFSEEAAHIPEVGAPLREHPIWFGATCIAAYISMPGEPPTAGLIAAARTLHKIIVLPRIVNRDHLELHRWEGEPLRPGAFGIGEPAPHSPAVAPEQVDLFLVPGLAFDRSGGRLGMGKGYYDRLLAGSPGFRVGICWEWQLLPEIPMEPHDQRMQAICTEHRLLLPPLR
ncbi:MAG TPA: 5-formyltetrahydrofolate cyclo-ligase [Myxococcota bacterium]|nr:5-formyltetrahydrofolate cyclo-ligase [Myxococcota bacterium]